MNTSSGLASVFAVVAVAACSGAPTGELPEHTSSTSNAIFGGTLDTTHQAVVAIDRLCTGTIIKTDPANGIGWVLTAAHCMVNWPDPGDQGYAPGSYFVYQGEDSTNPDREYWIVNFKVDPAYDSVAGATSDSNSGHDLAVVTISRVDANTRFIPITGNPDGIADTGTPLVSVGYGMTEPDASSTFGTRRQVTMVFGPYMTGYEEQMIATSNFSSEPDGSAFSGGAFCGGDSGGPDLLTTGGVERVVGVHSLGNCMNDGGVSTRVSYGLDFIKSQLPPDPPTDDAGATKDGDDSGSRNDSVDSGAGNGSQNSGTTDSTGAGSGGSGCSAGAVPLSEASHGTLLAFGAMVLTLARRRRCN
ncbi:MAG: trypsin-like serine protease [Polyangiaceae bacterium]|nr:trypsin-like serine protease [Polyangiaceae bacterium]